MPKYYRALEDKTGESMFAVLSYGTSDGVVEKADEFSLLYKKDDEIELQQMHNSDQAWGWGVVMGMPLIASTSFSI